MKDFNWFGRSLVNRVFVSKDKVKSEHVYFRTVMSWGLVTTKIVTIRLIWRRYNDRKIIHNSDASRHLPNIHHYQDVDCYWLPFRNNHWTFFLRAFSLRISSWVTLNPHCSLNLVAERPGMDTFRSVIRLEGTRYQKVLKVAIGGSHLGQQMW